jgi:hypothetical protein
LARLLVDQFAAKAHHAIEIQQTLKSNGNENAQSSFDFGVGVNEL